jgi:hypothetical protein
MLQYDHEGKEYMHRKRPQNIFNGSRKVVAKKVFGHHTMVGASSCRYVPRRSDDANTAN